jgi:hypothetical protein
LLGPELINLSTRLNPIYLEGVVAIRVSEQMSKELGLKDNQVIRGVIENRGDLLKLILNNREIDWTGSRRFRPGDRIDFRVETSVYGRVLSPIIGAVADTGAQSASPSARLLSLLFRQDQSGTQLLKPGGLDALLGQLGASDQSQRLSQLMQSMARPSPDAIKNGMLSSGLFGEYLLGSQAQVRPDLKQFLRGLLRMAVAQSQSQAIADIEQTIDQIEGRQLESLQSQLNREIAYNFTLPFTDANPVDVQLQRGGYNQEESESDWVINLHTESEDLGELWLQTTLRADDSLEMIMWAAQTRVAEMARAASSELEYELQSFGLQLSKMTVLDVPRPSLDPELSSPGYVVDVRT